MQASGHGCAKRGLIHNNKQARGFKSRAPFLSLGRLFDRDLAASTARRARLEEGLPSGLDRSHTGFVAGPNTGFAIIGLVAHFDLLESRRDASRRRETPFGNLDNAPEMSGPVVAGDPGGQLAECVGEINQEQTDRVEGSTKAPDHLGLVLLQVGTAFVTPTEGQLYDPTDGAVTVPIEGPEDP
jgi:hypothetical protein